MIWLLAAAGLAVADSFVQLDEAPLLTRITNVQLFRADGSVTGPHDVLLDQGLISAISPAGQDAGTEVSRTIDGTGGTLLPGLIDTHVHVSSTAAYPKRMRLPDVQSNLEACLFAGVTTVLDPGLSSDDRDRYLKRIDKGTWAAPELYWAGRPFTAPGGHPWTSVRASFPNLLVRLATKNIAWGVADGKGVKKAIAKQGLTPFIKVMLDELPAGAPVIDEASTEQLRIGATALDSKLVAHIGQPADVDRALAIPVDVLMHSPWAGRLSAAQADALAKQQIPVSATLTAWDAVRRYRMSDPAASPLMRTLQSEGIASDHAQVVQNGGKPTALDPWLDTVARAHDDRFANLALLWERGVTVLVGSDTPLFGIPAGAGLHHELDLLHAAGMPAADVLRAATWHNSRLFGDVQFGAIEAGWQADLVLVNGDPTTHLAAIHDIRAVWVDGRLADRTLNSRSSERVDRGTEKP